MADTYTLVIERRDGESLDIEDVRRRVGDNYKISTWLPGSRLMTDVQLREVRDRLESALLSVRAALGEPDEEGDGG